MIEALKKQQEEIAKLTRLVNKLSGNDETDSLQGLSENEKTFLQLEKKYKQPIEDRRRKMSIAEKNIKELEEQYEALEVKRSNAGSSEKVYPIVEEMNALRKKLEDARSEHARLELGEEQNILDDYFKEKSKPKDTSSKVELKDF